MSECIKILLRFRIKLRVRYAQMDLGKGMELTLQWPDGTEEVQCMLECACYTYLEDVPEFVPEVDPPRNCEVYDFLRKCIIDYIMTG